MKIIPDGSDDPNNYIIGSGNDLATNKRMMIRFTDVYMRRRASMWPKYIDIPLLSEKMFITYKLWWPIGSSQLQEMPI